MALPLHQFFMQKKYLIKPLLNINNYINNIIYIYITSCYA